MLDIMNEEEVKNTYVSYCVLGNLSPRPSCTTKILCGRESKVSRKSFSHGLGKDMLIKAIPQAIPTNVMSYFDLT